MRARISLAALAAAFLLAPTLSASSAQADEVEAAFDAWNVVHGGAWRLVRDPHSGAARCLWGGSAAANSTPRTDEQFFERAREVLVATQSVHLVEVETLADDRVTFLPLGAAGSTDKIAVRLHQRLGGMPVENGWVNLLFARDGALLSIDSQAVPGAADFDVEPLASAELASAVAAKEFQRIAGVAPELLGEAQLVVEQVLGDSARAARLVWAVAASAHAADGSLIAYEHRVDARSGEALGRRPLVHDFDVSGTVRTMATPGLLPDLLSNQPTSQTVASIRVNSSAGNVVTDANGNFNIVGATAPLQVSITYAGPWCSSHNATAANYTLNTTLNAASGNQVLMNPSSTAPETAQANAFMWVNRTHDWLKALNPADTAPDFSAWSNANIASSCNAYYSVAPPQPSINFFAAGGSCPNTAYSTVVVHELGHWLNDRYGTGNGQDGMGEGMADSFAMYLADSPVVGAEFFGANMFVRTGLNTRMFCGDGNGGCYGEVHADGEPLMGALWKVRARLKSTLGPSGGAMTADALFSAWLNGYDDYLIESLITVHWLTLDDDDGNIFNGTPNYLDINGGFRDQGFPGVQATLCPNFASYCTSSTTTNGCSPTMSFAGTPSASATSGCTLIVNTVEGQRTGLIFYGITGRVAFPWSAGSSSWFCVKSPVQRTFAHNSGGAPNSCGGQLAVDWNHFRNVFPGALGNPIQTGQKVQAQGWFRDPPAVKTTNLSDALEFTVCP